MVQRNCDAKIAIIDMETEEYESFFKHITRRI
jgi:hypothetical protein